MKKFLEIISILGTVKDIVEKFADKIVDKIKKVEPIKVKSNAGSVLGVLGIIFAPIFPVITYALSATGMALSAGGKKREKSKSGIALNSVALAFAAVNSVIAIVIAVMYYNKKEIPFITKKK